MGKVTLGPFISPKTPIVRVQTGRTLFSSWRLQWKLNIVKNVIINNLPHVKSDHERQIFISLMILCACSAQTHLSVIISMGKIDRNLESSTGEVTLGLFISLKSSHCSGPNRQNAVFQLAPSKEVNT